MQTWRSLNTGDVARVEKKEESRTLQEIIEASYEASHDKGRRQQKSPPYSLFKEIFY